MLARDKVFAYNEDNRIANYISASSFMADCTRVYCHNHNVIVCYNFINGSGISAKFSKLPADAIMNYQIEHLSLNVRIYYHYEF